MLVTRRMTYKVASVVGMRAGVGFHLERRMKHLEAFGEHGLQGLQQFFGLCAGRVHHMRRPAGLADPEGQCKSCTLCTPLMEPLASNLR